MHTIALFKQLNFVILLAVNYKRVLVWLRSNRQHLYVHTTKYRSVIKVGTLCLTLLFKVFPATLFNIEHFTTMFY